MVGSGIIFLGSQEHLLHEKWFLTAALAFAAGSSLQKRTLIESSFLFILFPWQV